MKGRILSFILALSMISSIITLPVRAENQDILNVNFDGEQSIADWDNAENVSFGTDSEIGSYIVAEGADGANAPKTASFTSSDLVCVEFDMMLPTKKYDGATDNTIGGGMTGGVALMQGDKIAGVIGFRGNSKGEPDHALSITGGSTNDYVNVQAGSKATAYRDTWLHYVVMVNAQEKTGDLYITDPKTGIVYTHVDRFDTYIKNISEVTNIGVVSTEGYSIALANLRVYNPVPDTVSLSSVDEMYEQYIPGSGNVSTVQYSAVSQYEIRYNLSGEYKGTGEHIEIDGEPIEYVICNIAGEEVSPTGMSISDSGLLSIEDTAVAGDYKIKAKCGDIESESVDLKVLANGEAYSVQIMGPEEVMVNSQTTYKSISLADTGAVLPDKETEWSIIGDDLGCTIENGVLTAGSNSGKIILQAKIVENEVLTQKTIYIRTQDEIDNAQVVVKGVFLGDGKTEFLESNKITGIAVDSKAEISNVTFEIAGYDKNNVCVSKGEMTADISDGVTGMMLEEPQILEKVKYVRVIAVSEENIISSKTTDLTNGIYKGIPIVGDWYTNAEVGAGKGVNASTPAGIDPDIVNTVNSKVQYTYDSNYKEITVDNMLWYKTGAYSSKANIYQQHGEDWEQQALPIGNGYLGGMVFGMPSKDHIQFNEETMWAGGYRGTQEKVTSTTINPNMGEGINGYMSAGDLFVDSHMPENATVTNYYRDLNLDTAVASVEYTYDGVKYNREYFASYPAESMVFHYTADADNAISFTVNPVMAHPGDITVNDGEITIVGKLKDSEPYFGSGNVSYAYPSDLEYCTKIKVIANGGTVEDNYAAVDVKNANDVTIILTSATDYDPNQFEVDSEGNAVGVQYKNPEGVNYAINKAESRLAKTEGKTYEELRAEHIADYKNLFDRVKFSLTDEDEVCQIPTNELQDSYEGVVSTAKQENGSMAVSYDENKYNSLDKHLEELHYNYARYMMISASRQNTVPANLQGKWCQSTAEIWGSGYTININLEMNYWFAGASNLAESEMALVGWLESQIPAGKITAKNMYNITPKSYKSENGEIKFTDSDAEEDDVFIMHTKQSIFGSTDMTGSTNIQSPGNTAWLMQNVWNLYQTTGDENLLRERLYPVLRKSANFYTQYMYANKRTTTDLEKYPSGYYYVTGQGRSPEQGPTQEGIYYDLQLVAGLFDYVIEAATILDVDSDKVSAWREIRDNIKKPVELGDDGQVKEWEQETTYNTDGSGNAIGDPFHRHLSHLVGLYPGTLINRQTPDLLDGAKIVLNNRGDDSTGWSCSFKMLLWSRTGNGNKALELFRYQLANKTYSNLFDYHAPFQIDGNFGSAAGVVEMLMQSENDVLYLLPALPDVWDKGEISGIKDKMGDTVSVKWENNEIVDANVIPKEAGSLKIGYESDMNGKLTAPDGTAMIVSNKGGVYTFTGVQSDVAYTFTLTDEEADPINIYEIKGFENSVITLNKVKNSDSEGHKIFVAEYENDTLTKVDIIDISNAQMGENQYNTTVSGNAKIYVWSQDSEPLADVFENLV